MESVEGLGVGLLDLGFVLDVSRNGLRGHVSLEVGFYV